MSEELTRIAQRVNGATQTVTIEPRESLLDVLLDHLRQTGTRRGCDQYEVKEIRI